MPRAGHDVVPPRASDGRRRQGAKPRATSRIARAASCRAGLLLAFMVGELTRNRARTFHRAGRIAGRAHPEGTYAADPTVLSGRLPGGYFVERRTVTDAVPARVRPQPGHGRREGLLKRSPGPPGGRMDHPHSTCSPQTPSSRSWWSPRASTAISISGRARASSVSNGEAFDMGRQVAREEAASTSSRLNLDVVWSGRCAERRKRGGRRGAERYGGARQLIIVPMDTSRTGLPATPAEHLALARRRFELWQRRRGGRRSRCGCRLRAVARRPRDRSMLAREQYLERARPS